MRDSQTGFSASAGKPPPSGIKVHSQVLTPPHWEVSRSDPPQSGQRPKISHINHNESLVVMNIEENKVVGCRR